MDANSIYIIASRLNGHTERLAMIADNVANANTTGFKKMVVDFEENAARKQGVNIGSFAKDTGSRIIHTPGSAKQTGNPLDVFLEGKGYLSIKVDGNTQYTRDGHLTVSPAGELITSNGHTVVDNNGSAIAIPPDAQEIIITPEGTLATEQGPIGSIGLFEFSDEQIGQLKRAGNNAFIAPGVKALPATDTTVIQGALESSNVNPVQETVMMTQVSRAYQSALKMIQQIEQLDQRGVRDLARMPQ